MSSKTQIPKHVNRVPVLNKQINKNRKTRTERAGLVFPVGRIDRILRKLNLADRIGNGASIYLASVLEYLCAEVLELAGGAAKAGKKQRICPVHIKSAIKNDTELSYVFASVQIPLNATALFWRSGKQEKIKKKHGAKKKIVRKNFFGQAAAPIPQRPINPFMTIPSTNPFTPMSNISNIFGLQQQQQPPMKLPHRPVAYQADGTPICFYDSACFRKNPAHFIEYAHPQLDAIREKKKKDDEDQVKKNENKKDGDKMDDDKQKV
ncbi:MAG: putative Histone H2A [Streblomastix strix]|uniref:Histone H2A n=1 Tax=Streblomastix strix TaxID=222440 RepID=A0A5J4WFB6_9EUKA|nr:MAG: putative Histone H2A [Streblomastix strix]